MNDVFMICFYRHDRQLIYLILLESCHDEVLKLFVKECFTFLDELVSNATIIYEILINTINLL